MTKQYFTKENIWSGGFYELSIEVGINADEQMRAVLQAICSYPKFEGFYLDLSKEPSEQELTPSTQIIVEEGLQLYGLALMPNGCRIVCGVFIVREESGLDWVNFYIPMKALGEAYNVGGYPYEQKRSSDHWQRPVDEWFAELGKHIYSAAPYRLGLIGFEVAGETDSEEVAEAGVPKERYISYLCPSGSDIRRYFRTESSSGFN
jgi:hypothetical protein